VQSIETFVQVKKILFRTPIRDRRTPHPAIAQISKDKSPAADNPDMDLSDRRRYPRVRIYDPVSYMELDTNDLSIREYPGIALNISQSGICIETFTEIPSKFIRLAFVDLADNLVEIKGRIVFGRRKNDGKFEFGVRLQGSHNENIRFARSMVKAFHYQKP